MTSVRHPAIFVIALILLAAAPALARAPEEAEDWNGAEIAWRDMASGVKDSIASGKNALLVFQATWCQVCRKFQTVFKDRRIVAASRELVMILIDVDKEPDLNSSFAPDGGYVPRTVFVNPEGNVLHELQSANPQYRYSADVEGPEELLSLMQRAAKTKAPPADDRAEN